MPDVQETTESGPKYKKLSNKDVVTLSNFLAGQWERYEREEMGVEAVTAEAREKTKIEHLSRDHVRRVVKEVLEKDWKHVRNGRQGGQSRSRFGKAVERMEPLVDAHEEAIVKIRSELAQVRADMKAQSELFEEIGQFLMKKAGATPQTLRTWLGQQNHQNGQPQPGLRGGTGRT